MLLPIVKHNCRSIVLKIETVHVNLISLLGDTVLDENCFSFCGKNQCKT